MTTVLHVLSRSPFSASDFNSCLALLSSKDGLLLTGDAVYALQANTSAYEQLHALAPDIAVFALEEDCLARHLLPSERIQLVDYPRFVELSCQFQRVNTWL